LLSTDFKKLLQSLKPLLRNIRVKKAGWLVSLI